MLLSFPPSLGGSTIGSNVVADGGAGGASIATRAGTRAPRRARARSGAGDGVARWTRSSLDDDVDGVSASLARARDAGETLAPRRGVDAGRSAAATAGASPAAAIALVMSPERAREERGGECGSG